MEFAVSALGNSPPRMHCCGWGYTEFMGGQDRLHLGWECEEGWPGVDEAHETMVQEVWFRLVPSSVGLTLPNVV